MAATLLNIGKIDNGWMIEEYTSPARVAVHEASAPACVLGRFYAMVHRVPSTKTVRVFYRQGATQEESELAFSCAVASAGPDWQRCTPRWWRRRAKNGKYRFYTVVGRRIDVEESFAQLTAELTSSINNEVTA